MRRNQIFYLIFTFLLLCISKTKAQDFAADTMALGNEPNQLELIFDSEQDDVSFQLINQINPSLLKLRKFGFSHLSLNQRGSIIRLEQFRVNEILLNDLNKNGNLWSIISSLNNLAITRPERVAPQGSQQVSLQNPNSYNQLALSYGIRSASRLNTTKLSAYNDNFNLAARARWGRDNTFDGVFVEDYSFNGSYSFNLSKSHSLSIGTAVSLSERGLKNCTTDEVFNLVKSNRGDNFIGYNPSVGIQNGRTRNASVVNNSSAIININDQLSLGKTDIKLSLAAIYDKQGFSTLARYDSNNPYPDYYQYLPSYHRGDAASEITNIWQSNPQTAMIDWNELYKINQTYKRARYIVEQRVSNLKSLRSNLSINHKVSPLLSMGLSIDGIVERCNYHKIADDMLGADYWLDIDTYLVDDVYYGDMVQNNIREPNRKILKGDKFGYNYSLDNKLLSSTIWMKYRNKGVMIDAQYSLGHNSVRRIGYYEKETFRNELSFGKSPKINFTTHKIDISVHYAHNSGYDIFARYTNGTIAPSSQNIFVSPRNQNQFIDTPNTPRIISTEIGVGTKHSRSELYVTLFSHYIKSLNQVINRYDEITTRYSHFVSNNISTKSWGIELESIIELSPRIELEGFISYGKYQYANNPHFKQYDDRDGKILNEDIISHIKGVPVHYAPQSLVALRLNWQPRYGIWVSSSVNYSSERAAKLDMMRRTDRILTLTDKNDVKVRLLEYSPLKETCSIDVNVGKKFTLGKYSLIINFSIENLTDQKIERYGYEQFHLNKIGTSYNKYYDAAQAKKCYDYGRSFNFSMSFTL